MTTSTQIRTLIESLDHIQEAQQKILCAAQTADGAVPFFVDSEETFDIIIELSDMGSGEADEWGGHEFNLSPDHDNEDVHWADDDFEEASFISLKSAKKGYKLALADLEENPDEDGYDSVAEDVYTQLVYGH